MLSLMNAAAVRTRASPAPMLYESGPHTGGPTAVAWPVLRVPGVRADQGAGGAAALVQVTAGAAEPVADVGGQAVARGQEQGAPALDRRAERAVGDRRRVVRPASAREDHGAEQSDTVKTPHRRGSLSGFAEPR